MGSIAKDKVGDILVGYSESSAHTYPSIAVAGRTVDDAPGTLESEVSVIRGTGSQPYTSNRWGDYSSVRIDRDGCTFWYTTEYYMVTQQFDWSTRIASAKFANCRQAAKTFARSVHPCHSSKHRTTAISMTWLCGRLATSDNIARPLRRWTSSPYRR